MKDVDLKREHNVVSWDVKADGPGHGRSGVRIDANTGAILKLDRHK